MEHLNLDIHDPEEYEGKSVIWNDCRYVIAERIGIGAQKIVHKLRNAQSGVGLHVAKILRLRDSDQSVDTPTGTPEQIARLHKLKDKEWTIAKLTNVGGWGVAISLNFNPIPLAAMGEQEDLFDRADSLVGEGRNNEALDAYQRLLTLNRYHTHALHNAGVILLLEGQPRKAWQYLVNAVAIEPNYPDYGVVVIKCAAACGYAYAGLERFDRLKSRFPFITEADETGIMICQATGRIERAFQILSEAYGMEETTRASYTASLQKDAAARERSGASKLFNTTAWPSLSDLTTAHNEYPNDPLVATNFGLALRQAGRVSEAKNILLAQVYRRDYLHDRLCFANAAFSCIIEEQWDEAVRYLEPIAEALGFGRTNVAFADVPGFCVFVLEINGQTAAVEEKKSSLELMERLGRALGEVHPQAGIVSTFIAAYKELNSMSSQN